MIAGALWCAGGIFITVFSFSLVSESGGTYVIAWGAIVFGAIQFYRGLMSNTRAASTATNPKHLLNIAASLETVNRPKAIAIYQYIVAQFPGTSASAEAQRNIQALTAETTGSN